MVSKALAFNMHLSHPFDSSGGSPFLERKGKGRLMAVTLGMVEERLGYRSELAFPCPAVYRLMLTKPLRCSSY